MNPATLILLACCLIAFAALGCLCLAMPRNSHRFGLSLPHPALRWSGWSLMGFLILFAITTQGRGFGLVSVLGALSLSALTIVGLLTYQPRWMICSTACSALAGLLLIGVSILTDQRFLQA